MRMTWRYLTLIIYLIGLHCVLLFLIFSTDRSGVCHVTSTSLHLVRNLKQYPPQSKVSNYSTNRIRVSRGTVPSTVISTTESTTQKKDSKIRLLCVVLTIDINHWTRARAVNRTWARRCDKTLFCSNKYTPYLPMLSTRSMPNNKKLVTLRLYNLLQKMYPDILDRYDWVYISDDDTYLIVENLKYFLRDYPQDEINYLGFNFPMFDTMERRKLVFAHGGSGYALSIPALKRLLTQGIDGTRRCIPSKHDGTYADINVAWCLGKLNVNVKDTADRKGRERFLKENPFQLLQNHTGSELKLFGYRDLVTEPKRKYEALSEESISFHYISPGEMYAIDFLLYNLARGPEKAKDINGLLNVDSSTVYANRKISKLNEI